MKTVWCLGWCLALVAGSAAAVTPTEGFDRYQIILDRQPFNGASGAPTAGTTLPVEQSFAKNLRISALLDLPTGCRVGLISTTSTNQNYLLGVGEKSEDGVELVAVHYVEEEAVLRKGTEEVVLKLASPTAAASGLKSAAAMEPPSADAGSGPRAYWERRRFSRGFHSEGQSGPPSVSSDHLQRMQQRLQDYQLRAIRNGQPPLPVPLSPETDAQLVKEGLLPPQN